MSILFAAAKLSPRNWDQWPFSKRVELLKSQYNVAKFNDIDESTWWFPRVGLAVYVAVQKQEHQIFSHRSKRDTRTDFISHAPFGYKAICPSSPLDDIPSALVDKLHNDSRVLLKLSPAQTIISVDEETETFSFWNDLLGLSKCFGLSVGSEFAISNRPVAAHILAGYSPVPSINGWASEQLHGWFLSELSPFENTRQMLGGTHVVLGKHGTSENRNLLVGEWFTQKQSLSTFEGFGRFISEFDEFCTPSEMDIALSGGRDSRASAALISSTHLDKIRFRTNEPPALEGIVARQLVQKLPNFGALGKDDTRAVDAFGRVIWKANTPVVIEAEVHQRAKDWARVGEGITAPVSIYSNPPKSTVFSSTAFVPSFAGVAGESAKAYYWSPNMVSGAYATSLKRFQEDIKLKISERLKSHPLTVQNSYPIISKEFRMPIAQLVLAGQKEATSQGIHGYRFLDYWWLTNRFGLATTVAYSGTATIMPFMVPEYISEAMQGIPADRARAKFLNDIVNHYRPEWAGVPYYDELQNHVPKDQLRFYRERSLLWEGELAKGFFEILRESPAFDQPYDRRSILELFSSDIPQNQKQGLNVKALGLLHRHAFWEMCREVGMRIAQSKEKKPTLKTWVLNLVKGIAP